jgi:hypothetical protein
MYMNFGYYELHEPRLCACQPGYGPIAIADWSIIAECHLLAKHGF